jgi:hypothetical protein
MYDTVQISHETDGLSVRTDTGEELAKLYPHIIHGFEALFKAADLWEHFDSLDEAIDFITEVFSVKCCVVIGE